MADPRGHVERLAFNSDHYITSDTQAYGTPLARTTTTERQTGSNLVTAVTDGLGRRTEFTYDANGHVLTTTRLAGTGNAVTTTYTYEPVFHRRRTGATTWDEARASSAAVEAVGNWNGQPVATLLAPARITIDDSTSIFLKNRQSAHIAPATLRKYPTFTKQLTAYADGRGHLMIDQFTPSDATYSTPD